MTEAINKDSSGWHLDKKVSVGHLVSTAILLVGAVTWASGIEKRIDQNALAAQYMAAQQTENKKKVEDLRKEIKSDLRAISDKLDRLIEKQIN